ncbi:hypothetical protein [Methanothrix sp.]|uniref:hypothetical protein n=1 Tax=Methanothrix sp. TaxID=90426 RepID=UPI0034E1C48F
MTCVLRSGTLNLRGLTGTPACAVETGRRVMGAVIFLRSSARREAWILGPLGRFSGSSSGPVLRY